MNSPQSAQAQLEGIIRSQVNAQFAESYNLGINANVDYSNKVLRDMKQSGLFYFTKGPNKPYK